MKILICEDEVLIALALEDLVIELGHTVVGPVRSAAEARSLSATSSPDVALVDLGLADGWTGPKLIEEFAAAGIECVVISGQTEDFDGTATVLACLPKPVDERRLAAILTERGNRA